MHPYIQDILLTISGVIFYSAQESLKYILNKDKKFKWSVWLKSNYVSWLWSLVFCILFLTLFHYWNFFKKIIEKYMFISSSEKMATIILIGTLLGSLTKAKTKE